MDNVINKQPIPFTQVPNELLYNPNISFKAKGLWAYMSAKPAGWNFSADRIAQETKEERKAILAGLKELAEYGYITAKKLPNGRIEYTLHWEVVETKKETPNQVADPEINQDEPTKETPSADVGADEPMEKPSSGRRRPMRSDYEDEETFVKAFYKWNSM